MKIKSYKIPLFYIDSLTDKADSINRELIRYIEINASAYDIFTWLKQLRIAPYSYDLIDNNGKKSPDYIVENLPPLQINTHFLLAFHIQAFEEDLFIACRFCEPINPPVSSYMKGLYAEYRITEYENKSVLWCKLKGYFNSNLSSRGFFYTFSAVNKIMMTKQLKNIKKLSENLSKGKVTTGTFNLKNYFPKSGFYWWIFCRRQGCNGLLT